MPIDNPAVVRLLNDFRRRLAEHLGPRVVQVTLFGSYARGQARPDSDVDVAVVLDEIRSHAERVLPMGLAGELVVEHGLVLAPIVMSVCELALLREREDSLAANLDGEGISL